MRFGSDREAGLSLFDRADYTQAEGFLTSALGPCPLDTDVLYRLAYCKAVKGDMREAGKLAALAVSLDPGCYQAITILSEVCILTGDYAGAEAYLDRVLEIAPHCPSAEWKKSHCELIRGDFANGFRRNRYGRSNKLRPVRFPDEQWDGSKTGTLFVWTEQGRGDVVQFSRFLPSLKQRAERVVFETYADLVQLYKSQEWAPDAVVMQPPDFHCPYSFDAHVSLVDLPVYLGIEKPEDVECPPYIKADPNLDASQFVQGRKVGIVWQGSGTHQNDAARSIPKECLKPLLKYPLVSLQKYGECPDEWLDLGPYLNGYHQTAAVIDLLDVVVTVDTSVAHLAGAMGKEVLMMVPLNKEWRWGLDGDKTCWYGSMTLVREDSFDDVVKRFASRIRLT